MSSPEREPQISLFIEKRRQSRSASRKTSPEQQNNLQETTVIAELSGFKKDDIIGRIVKGFAKKAYRSLLVSYCDYDEREWERLKGQANDFQSLADKEIVESGLTLIGIFALVDPLRDGIARSVDRCHKSGINVRMVTGDHIDTAIAISKQAHIITDADLADTENQQYVCMTGE